MPIISVHFHCVNICDSLQGKFKFIDVDYIYEIFHMHFIEC